MRNRDAWEVVKVILFMVAIVVVCALLLVAFFAYGEGSPKDDRTQFIQGLDYGRIFLGPTRKIGKKYRAGLQKMHERFGPWCWKYAPRDYVPCLSRIWLESRGNPWSRTKDMALLEAGLTSVSKETATRIKHDLGIAGDPCGDPELSIAMSAWRGAEQRKNMLEGVKDPEASVPEPTWWAAWLPKQWEANRIEAEFFMGLCGGVNCQKVKRAIVQADAEKGILDGIHVWWGLMNWLRDQNEARLVELFSPLRKTQWMFGTRWGRIMGAWDTRAEFFPPLSNGDPNYCWGDEPYFYPFRAAVETDASGGILSVDLVPVFPEPLYPFPKKDEWRDRCVLYGTKGWYKAWDEPKRNDRWKKGGFQYAPVTGAPITVKKGEKKYATQEEFQAAWEAWKDEAQAARLLPSDEEYATWEQDMAGAGCAFIPFVNSD